MYNENADQRHKIRTILYIAAALLAFGKTKPYGQHYGAYRLFLLTSRRSRTLESRDFSGIITVQGKYPEKREYGGTGRRTRFRFWRRDPCRFDSCYSHQSSASTRISRVEALLFFSVFSRDMISFVNNRHSSASTRISHVEALLYYGFLPCCLNTQPELCDFCPVFSILPSRHLGRLFL